MSLGSPQPDTTASGKCPYAGRHWFTARAHVGVQTRWPGLTDGEREWIADALENGWGESA